MSSITSIPTTTTADATTSPPGALYRDRILAALESGPKTLGEIIAACEVEPSHQDTLFLDAWIDLIVTGVVTGNASSTYWLTKGGAR